MLTSELINLLHDKNWCDWWSVDYRNFWTKERLRSIRCKEYIRCCSLFFMKSVMRKACIQLYSGNTWFVSPNGLPQKWILDFLLVCKVWLPAACYCGVCENSTSNVQGMAPLNRPDLCKVLSPTSSAVNLCGKCPGHFNKHHPVFLPIG